MVTTAAALGIKSGVQAITEIAVKTTVINTVSGAVDAGTKDIVTKAIKGENQSFTDTAKKMGEGAFIAAISSGLTEGIIANGSKTVCRCDNLLTRTLSEPNIIQPKWAGTVGNIGENVVPTARDVYNSLTGDE